MKIFLISNNRDTLVGMRLAGVKGKKVEDKRDGEKLLESLVRDKSIGIILITEKLAEAMKEKINFIKIKRNIPLIVEIPDRYGSIKDESYITGYIKDSIGINI